MELDSEVSRVQALLRQREQEVQHVSQVAAKLTSERDHVADVVRQEFADRLAYYIPHTVYMYTAVRTVVIDTVTQTCTCTCIIVLHARHVWYAYHYGIVLYYYSIVLYCGGMLELQAPTTRGMLESQDAIYDEWNVGTPGLLRSITIYICSVLLGWFQRRRPTSS